MRYSTDTITTGSEIPTALTSDITSGVSGQMSPPIEIVAGSISVLLVLTVIIVILVAALLFVSNKKKKKNQFAENIPKNTGISQEGK